jgi:hypothetical protein
MDHRARSVVSVLLAVSIIILTTAAVDQAWCREDSSRIRSEEVAISRAVRSFVHQRYIEGVPYLKARALGAQAIPILQGLLADPLEEEFWPTIVMTMGFIGDEAAVDALIDFLENRFEREVSIDQFRALLVVNSALGHIAGEGSARALDYLAESCYVGTWQEKNLRWSYGTYSGERLAVLLAKIGVNGLSFSGTERAHQIMSDLQLRPEAAKYASALEPNIEEGLVRLERIRTEGRDRVFGGQ